MSLGDEGKEAGGCGGGFVRSGAWALLSRDKHRGTGDFRWTGLPGNRSLFGQKDFSLPHSFLKWQRDCGSPEQYGRRLASSRGPPGGDVSRNEDLLSRAHRLLLKHVL